MSQGLFRDECLVVKLLKVLAYSMYSKTPIYRGVWEQGNIRGKSGSAVNRGFVWFTITLCMFSPIWGKGNGRGISGFAINRGAVNRGFTAVWQNLHYFYFSLV